MIVTENPPTSEIASEYPLKISGRFSTIQCDPKVLPASSSAKKMRRILRGGTKPVRAHERTIDKNMASPSFISTAPRPRIYPSLISPQKGSKLQSAALAGTTSRWPWTTSPGRLVSLPAIRATTLNRFGPVSMSSESIPTSANLATTYRATASSSPLPSP